MLTGCHAYNLNPGERLVASGFCGAFWFIGPQTKFTVGRILPRATVMTLPSSSVVRAKWVTPPQLPPDILQPIRSWINLNEEYGEPEDPSPLFFHFPAIQYNLCLSRTTVFEGPAII
jgi:hypothetical protein